MFWTKCQIIWILRPSIATGFSVIVENRVMLFMSVFSSAIETDNAYSVFLTNFYGTANLTRTEFIVGTAGLLSSTFLTMIFRQYRLGY